MAAGRRPTLRVRSTRRRATLVCGLLLLGGCSVGLPGTTTGSGSVRTETRSVTGFTAVELAGNGMAQVQQTGTDSLTVTAEDNVLPLLTSEVVDKVLKLGVKDNAQITTSQPITYQITLRDLTALTVAGSGSQSATNVKVGALQVRIAGSGSVTASGTADSQSIDLAGSGAYDGSGLASGTAKVNSAGSGNVDLAVRDRLEVTIIGSGNVTFTGSPQVTQSVLGSGTLQKK